MQRKCLINDQVVVKSTRPLPDKDCSLKTYHKINQQQKICTTRNRSSSRQFVFNQVVCCLLLKTNVSNLVSLFRQTSTISLSFTLSSQRNPGFRLVKYESVYKKKVCRLVLLQQSEHRYLLKTCTSQIYLATIHTVTVVLLRKSQKIFTHKAI